MHYVLLAFLLLPAVQASAATAGDPPGDVLVLRFPDAPALAGYDEGRLLVRVMWDADADGAAWMDVLRVAFLAADSVAFYHVNEAIESPADEGPAVLSGGGAAADAAVDILREEASAIVTRARLHAGRGPAGRPVVIAVHLIRGESSPD
jgi:hypothetical protein